MSSNDFLEQIATAVATHFASSIVIAGRGENAVYSGAELDFISGYIFAFSDVFVQATMGENSTLQDTLKVMITSLKAALCHKDVVHCVDVVDGFLQTNAFSSLFSTGMDSGTEDVNAKLQAMQSNNPPVAAGRKHLIRFFQQ